MAAGWQRMALGRLELSPQRVRELIGYNAGQAILAGRRICRGALLPGTAEPHPACLRAGDAFGLALQYTFALDLRHVA